MRSHELESILSAIPRVRIAVVGDFCLDAYWSLDPAGSRPSVETGLPTRAVRESRFSLGGAGNVAANLAALGVGRVAAFGVAGDDPFGREMRRLLEGIRVDAEGLLVQAGDWSTPTYIKPVEGGAEQNRLDFGGWNALSGASASRLTDLLREAVRDLDAVIINQQLPRGLHADAFRGALARLIGENAAGRGIPFLVDSRDFPDSFPGAVRKLNDREALRLCGGRWEADGPVPLADLGAAVETLASRWGEPLFVTRGSRGMVVRHGGALREAPGIEILGRIDSVGAGDSALAGIACALAAGFPPLEAAEFGNLAASVTVRKLFTTGTAAPDEVRAAFASVQYVHRPDLAADVRRARLLEGTEVEVVSEGLSPMPLTHAVFDHDGTVSTLREGWEQVMEPVMVRAILGERWKEADEGLYREVEARVREFIDKTTGVQTLAQMKGLVGLVKEFAVVPAEDVRDEHHYKALFNREILALARSRTGKLSRGELSLEDLTVKGAVAFLRRLHASGVILHLASGTDEEDVKAEAAALGYADLFEGRIHGSVGRIDVEAKKVVLDRILDGIVRGGPARAQVSIATFGDGPVEIRETAARGGLAVGVASDEVRRYGLNPRKRTRLIRAGAHIVVPDFTQADALLSFFRLPREEGRRTHGR